MTISSAMISENINEQIKGLDKYGAAKLVQTLPAVVAGNVLRSKRPDLALEIFSLLPEEQRTEVINQLPSEISAQWKVNKSYPAGSIGSMLEPAIAVFHPDTTVADTIDLLRPLVKKEFITYAYMVDDDKKLKGILVFRELLFAQKDQRLSEIMIKNPFSLNADDMLLDAMKEVLKMHFPVYPVVNKNGQLVGQIRGYQLFEAQAIEISAQAGTMVGVEKEEKLSTSWGRSFKYRHPWLQLNLLTAFLAGGVVGFFQDTLDQLVIMAVFIPVLSGQSGNTGCQSLAVTLRAMSLGEFKRGGASKAFVKEGILGLLNGSLVGISAAVGMYLLASSQGDPQALKLSLVVFVAMTGSCIISGISGAVVPLALRRFGADPATASSIFLTSITDIVSIGLLLYLAQTFINV